MNKAIGIGNRLMMDDGIAIAVLESIRDNLKKIGWEVIIGETDLLFSFNQIKEDDFVIILDATYSGGLAGSVSYCKLEEAITSYGAMNYQHDMSIFDLMRLYSKYVRGYFIGIEIAEVGFQCELSDTLKKMFEDICLYVENLIKEIVKEEISYA
ncbi:MAG: hydrogenase maturation protease [Anaerolineaceae bacterium]|nr:MAG: hydrogenase maturation protease [Anaerolineaceae bacterium]